MSSELLCEASLDSLNSILSSISSHASELAVNVVNNLLEDQVADPKNVEKNLARVKSVFSTQNFLSFGSGDGVGGGDYYYSHSLTKKEAKPSLLTLPRKVRQQIWSYLDDKTVKTLRYVCDELRFEMDYDVGLTVVLRQDSFSNLWMRSLSVRSCVIKHMDSIFTLNNFCRPDKLERLSLDPELQVDPDITELIIRKFRNLQQLIIYTEDVLVVKNNLDEGTPNPNSSSRMISRLEDQFRLTSIDVKFDTSKWKLKWNIKMKPQNYEMKYVDVQDAVGPFGLCGMAKVASVHQDLCKKTLKTATISIPFVQDRDRFMWLKILQFQNALSSLTCDLNATHWKDYEKIIRGNQRTLKKLFLLNITCSGKRCSLSEIHSEEELPFDWRMLENCGALEEITLIAETFLHTSITTFSLIPEGQGDHSPQSSSPRKYIPSENITSLQSPHLKAVWLENFHFNKDEVNFLKSTTTAGTSVDVIFKDKPRFEICTLKNCKLGEEAVSEAHLGLKKERNRSLECLCFGTIVYDDDDLENFERYTAEKLAEENLAKSRAFRFRIDDLDMIECFRLAGRADVEEEGRDFGSLISENMNLIGGVAFTIWLYYC